MVHGAAIVLGGFGPAYTSSLLPSLNTTRSPLPNAFHALLVKVSAIGLSNRFVAYERFCNPAPGVYISLSA